MQKIEYKYDYVGNITNQRNGASPLRNGLGGKYEYDELYRLKKAEGKALETDFFLEADYHLNGKWKEKRQRAHITGPGAYTMDYWYEYHYKPGHSNQLETVGNRMGGHANFEWDENGNMTFYYRDDRQQVLERRLAWDDENRLRGTADQYYKTFYGYNADGERTWKTAQQFGWMNINGQYFSHAFSENRTLYASPYLVATPKGYTKHYYAGEERVLSRIGEGGIRLIDMPLALSYYARSMRELYANLEIKPYVPPKPSPHEPMFVDGKPLYKTDLYDKMLISCRETEEKCIERFAEVLCTKAELNRDLMKNLYAFRQYTGMEPEMYFYHTDHLGSSSWVTDRNGMGIQHVQYLPFGEPWIDQQYAKWSAPYTFSGKERDEETGYSYFGTRYYDSDLSIWLSVDPLASKYPSVSPYVYCVNNPVKYWDPDGRWIPGLDNDGNVTYTAEKGDNHDTFVTQFSTEGKSRDIFKNAGLGVHAGDVKEGNVIKGDAVKKATGSDVLKGNWSNMTKTQKAAQIIFAANHSKNQGEYEFDFQDYAIGFESYAGQSFSDITYPTKNGFIKIRNMSMWLTNSNSRVRNRYQYTQSYGDWIGKFDFRLPKEGARRTMILFSIDPQYDDDFGKLFRNK